MLIKRDKHGDMHMCFFGDVTECHHCALEDWDRRFDLARDDIERFGLMGELTGALRPDIFERNRHSVRRRRLIEGIS